ncbi:hypothetical protein [Thermus caldilimi]|uniref:hypothetical protein n=1 Tax=Thermus caldilimi TaxID=2483360 RepID=UPI001076906B|nr:hypothetical protein [Thermus caldilimi]
MKTVALPEDVAQALEKFRKAWGRRWRRNLIELLAGAKDPCEEVRLLLREVRSLGLTEEEVYRRLRLWGWCFLG